MNLFILSIQERTSGVKFILVTALRTLTLLLLIILIGLSFYLIWEALQRCQVVTARLNQEIRDFRDLTQHSDSDHE